MKKFEYEMETVLLTAFEKFEDFANDPDANARTHVGVKFGQFYLAAASSFAASLTSDDGSDAPSAILQRIYKLKFWALIPTNKGFTRDFEFRRVYCTSIHSCLVVKNTLNQELHDAQLRNSVRYNLSDTNCQFLDTFFLFRETDSKDKNSEALQKLLDTYTRSVNRSMVGESVAVISTPFKNLALFNTYSQGVICNVFGRDDCVFLIDVKLSVGCEGSPVFSLQNHLLGLVMNVFTWVRGEWTGFSMVVNLHSVLCSWISSSYPKLYKSIADENRSTAVHNIDSYGIVVITTPYKWGTGILMNKQEGIIITCSHVVNFTTQIEVTVTFKGESLAGYVVYATPEDTPFDLAVIKVHLTSHFNEVLPFKKPTKTIEKGETVYVIAYPLFSLRNHSIKGPTLTHGHVANIYPDVMVLTTCITNSGASGGALIRANGELLGVVANNVVIRDEGLLVPHITVVIPFNVFWTPVERFGSTRRVTELQGITTQDRNIRNVWQLAFAGKFMKSKL